MSNKIQLIIWSRDRAAQTETLLNSIERFAPDIFDPYVIWSFSKTEYLAGYNKLFEENKVQPFHKQEGNGKKLLLNLLRDESRIMCFTTEDTILHNKVPKSPIHFMDNCDIFSLRLGVNTVVQNHVTGELQPVLTNYLIEEPINSDPDWIVPGYGKEEQDKFKVLSWNFLNYPPLCNYGYPFGLDMVCYKKEVIVPLIEKCNFDKPNQLESELIRFRNSVNPNMKSFDYSCAVNVPITNMSQITASAGVYIEELNTQFLSGKKLRYKPVKIVGCHQILEYEWI